MELSEIRKTVEKLREQPITLPDANMALYPVPTVMYLAQHAIDLAAENERLKAKAKHYVCVRERNRETIDDLKGKLNAAESENERLKNTLNSIEFLLQTQNDGADKTSMIRDLMAKHYRQGR